ncbi:cytochrome P450 750A1-like [Cryptomeria japonica]|uniref:cytochrome P450 750A1-like n=1 Tax=Cryptomeria japonica TaxID=3369 RepID=UPI0027DA9CEC|nr:cytochrome P450 750A1-like [Cryptomeria japonica]
MKAIYIKKDPPPKEGIHYVENVHLHFSIFITDCEDAPLNEDACLHLGKRKQPKQDKSTPNWPHGFEMDDGDSNYTPSNGYVLNSFNPSSEVRGKRKAADSITITDDHIKAIVFNVFAGGMETMSTTMEWTMSSLIQNPHVLKKLQAEVEAIVGKERVVQESELKGMEYLLCVVNETVRLYPAVPLLIPHESTEDCIIDGYFIPKKSRAFVNGWALGRDPKVWKDPLEFKPERFMGRDIDFIKGKEYFDVVPFGAGRRACPGISMSFSMMTFTIAQLVHCFDWRVEGELDMSECNGASLPRKHDILAIPSLRVPTCP